MAFVFDHMEYLNRMAAAGFPETKERPREESPVTGFGFSDLAVIALFSMLIGDD